MNIKYKLLFPFMGGSRLHQTSATNLHSLGWGFDMDFVRVGDDVTCW